MNTFDSLYCIYNNLLINFYVILNLMFPYYSEFILSLQYKNIELVNENIVFGINSRKRRRFNTFLENIIQKNKEFIEKIRQQEIEEEKIENYTPINSSTYVVSESDANDDGSECSDDTEEDVIDNATYNSTSDSVNTNDNTNNKDDCDNTDEEEDKEEQTSEEETIYEKKNN